MTPLGPKELTETGILRQEQEVVPTKGKTEGHKGKMTRVKSGDPSVCYLRRQ